MKMSPYHSKFASIQSNTKIELPLYLFHLLQFHCIHLLIFCHHSKFVFRSFLLILQARDEAANTCKKIMAAIIPMPPPSHETVVRHFVRSYYKLLNQAPEFVSRFYVDSSEIVRPEPDGSISCTNTVRLIRMKIMSQHNKRMKAEVLSSDYTKLDDENFKIYVTGHFKGEDVHGFAQSFHLVFINKRYSVLHDILHYLNIPARVDGVSAGHTPLVQESADLEPMMKQITFESEIVPGDSQDSEQAHQAFYTPPVSSLEGPLTAKSEDYEAPRPRVISDLKTEKKTAGRLLKDLIAEDKTPDASPMTS